MRFDGLDLNLLVALDALLIERSVSGAAERLRLTPSATSHALARLRTHFGDDLIHFRTGQAELTPRAAQLEQPLREMLARIRQLVSDQSFDPRSSTRTIRLMVSDYALAAGVSTALAEAQNEAPAMSFDLRYPENSGEELEQGRADLIVLPHAHVALGHPAEKLFDDHYVVVVSRGSPLADGCDLDAYFTARHVAPRLPGTGNIALADRVTLGAPRPRQIAVAAPSFAAVPAIVAAGDLVATLPYRLAEHFTQFYPLRILPVPFAAPPIEEMVQRRSSSVGDAALDWLVDRLTRQFASGE